MKFIAKKEIEKHIEMLEEAIEDMRDGFLIENSYKTAMDKIKKIKVILQNKAVKRV